MKLKLVSVDKKVYSIVTRYIDITRDISIVYRSPSTGTFPTDETIWPFDNPYWNGLDKSIVAVITGLYTDGSTLEISKHQGAYLIDAGKTEEVINIPADWDDVVFRSRRIGEEDWEEDNLRFYIESTKWGREREYLIEGKEPKKDDSDSLLIRSKEKILWMRNSKGTSTTWRPCSQSEYDMNRQKLDYQFIECHPGEDPNQPK